MNDLEKEKMMVRGMKESGMTLAEIAKELEMDRSTVYTRYNKLYAPNKVKGKKKALSEKEKIKAGIKKDEERLIELEKENTEIDEEINRPLHRTYEKECEYRKKHDKDPKTPGPVPIFDEEDGIE